MCTSIICGRKATADNTVMIARNEDFGQNIWNKYMVYRVQPPYAADDKEWVLGNGLRVPVPEKWYPYNAMPDADGQTEVSGNVGNHFCYEARGINSRNVAMSATNSVQMNDKAAKADPVVSCGIEEAILVTLILPQAETAKGAAKLIGGYVEQYGASEAAGILLSDENEGWYVEIGSGHHWIAVRVPDDSYFVVSNSMRVHDVDLDDKKNVLFSVGLYEFVCQKELLKKPDRHCFDFAAAFGQQEKNEDGKADPYYNIDRLWLAQNILSPFVVQPVRQKIYPMFLKPDKPITVSKVMEMLRAVFAGTPLDHLEGATRPIGVVRCAESHILVMDKSMPGSLKGTIWQAMGSPLGSAYVPFYARTAYIPEEYACGDSEHFESYSVYWAWKTLFALCDKMDCLGELENFRDEYEQRFMKEDVGIRKQLKALAKKDPALAESLADTASYGRLAGMEQAVIAKYGEFISRLIILQKDRNLFI